MKTHIFLKNLLVHFHMKVIKQAVKQVPWYWIINLQLYKPSSMSMKHTCLLSSADAAIYSLQYFTIHQLVQHQPRFGI